MSPVTVTSLHLTIGLLCFILSTPRILTMATNSHSSSSVHGLPCVRRLNQLYCPTAGRNYPSIHKPQATFDTSTVIFHSELFLDQVAIDPSNGGQVGGGQADGGNWRFNFSHAVHKIAKRQVHRFLIDSYIDENKAMIKRMFGEYSPPDSSARETFATFDGSQVMQQGKSSSASDSSSDSSSFNQNDASNVNYNNNNNYNNANYINKVKRVKRTSFSSKFNDHNKIDTCESAVEIVTPYWASNSAGKIRAIVNTQHLQQAIQQEVCQSVQTKRCKDDCTCEQKYKWHRLLAYDPDDDCKGIFMDWFLFPSCCVCRCTNPLIG